MVLFGPINPTTKRMPEVVRAALALDLANAATPEGAAVAAVAASGGGGGTVFFGSDPNTARPVSAQPIVWVGYTGVVPVNAENNDLVFTSAAPADSIAPTVGTLTASAITNTGFTLTVTGAADETGLHATPYAFSTDGGTDWSAYQSSPVYSPTGLTADTGYSCQHRVRDAALNVSTGTAQTVTTTGASSGLTFRQDGSDLTDNLSTYTFTGQSIGVANASRRVIVGVSWSSAISATENALTSATIGGVAATIDAYSGHITDSRQCAIISAIVPTGTTADIVVNLAANSLRMGIGVWTVNGADPTGASNVSKNLVSGTLSVTTTAGDHVVCVGVATNDGAAPINVNWTGATERYETLFETNQHIQSGADVVASGTTTNVNYAIVTNVPERIGFVAAVYG